MFRGVCLVGISVEDAKQAFEVAVQNGGRPVSQPAVLQGPDGQESVISEVEMYGDVVMRFMSGSFQVDVRPRSSMMHACPHVICFACVIWQQCQDFIRPNFTLHACHVNEVRLISLTMRLWGHSIFCTKICATHDAHVSHNVCAPVYNDHMACLH